MMGKKKRFRDIDMLALRPKTDSFATILNRIQVLRFHLVSVLTVEVPLDEEFLQMLSGKHLLAP